MMVLNGKLERIIEGFKAGFVKKEETPELYQSASLVLIPDLKQWQNLGQINQSLGIKNTHNFDCVLSHFCVSYR